MWVADVLALIAPGADEAEVLDDYPYLPSEDLNARLTFAAAQANHAVVTEIVSALSIRCASVKRAKPFALHSIADRGGRRSHLTVDR